MSAAASSTSRGAAFRPPGRLFLSTAEACRELGVLPHTLKYWEKRIGLRFHRAAVSSTSRGARRFRREDVELLRRVKTLLGEGYGLAGVRRLLRGEAQPELPLAPTGRPAERQPKGGGAPDGPRVREVLRSLKRDLEKVRDVLDRGRTRHNA